MTDSETCSNRSAKQFTRMTEERINSMAQEVYDYLKRDCIGVQTCTADAVEAVFPGVMTPESDDDLWAIHDALYHLVSKERKYVCSFYLRPRAAKSSAWKIRIPYFNTGEMIDIVPDKEFLPGGAREGQCDGWTYHIEFVSMRDYFSADYDERELIGDDLPPKEEWLDALINHPNKMD